MAFPLFQVDAFTERPFAGNPAAVCLLERPAEAAWMQAVAREMNLSETAFLHPEGGAGEWRLRWFTPEVEVDLCGHATLASAHVLWETGRLAPAAEARFQTRSGQLTARLAGAEAGGWIMLDFPARPAEPCTAPGTVPPDLAAALGATPRWVGKYNVGSNRMDVLVELASDAEVRALKPDLERLKRVPVRATVVTAHSSDAAYDFVSRVFGPAVGIPEDPVTGSAHCCLGPYWGAKLGKTSMTAYQASARGGVIRVTLAGERVLLGGQAVTVLRGELA
ncbi:MAG: PhzF family phenazine biosynthesis protein [Candidatus Lambdaproteobacteria bacterium]|nr:PhzF family phenazine biosynthesis protein [Candidatus Lambdaproteobacteria bacterium]